ncbi:MAG: hypothetical protein ACP5LF_04215 [Nitrososphaeria archaeon]
MSYPILRLGLSQFTCVLMRDTVEFKDSRKRRDHPRAIHLGSTDKSFQSKMMYNIDL